ncbi:class I SAM-dependent methyltransferase [Ktedonobacteria bacterium brp13]|nr:class I SAM-dependent methyltransferase [Ktedonobacteria bacterium brp13]
MRFFKRASKQPAPPELTSNFDDLSLERRYRVDVPYLLPKDIEEGDRLNFQHYALRQILKGNFVAPIPAQVQQILDVGSGTGLWGHEMARQFPSAQVWGLDLEPPQTVSLTATTTVTPANYHFLQADIFQGLPFRDSTFDFTHQRLLVFAIPAARWPFVLRELVRVTRLDGWIELLDVEGFYQMGPVMTKADSWLRQTLQARGIQLDIMLTLDGMLRQAINAEGAHVIHFDKKGLDLPMGSRNAHDRIGLLLEKNIFNIFCAFKPVICSHLQIESQAYDQMLQALTAEWKQYSTRVHGCIVTAQIR